MNLNMEHKFSYSTLLCQENETTLTMVEEDCDEDNDEYVQTLINREMASEILQYQDSSLFKNVDWIQQARGDAVHYIIKTGESFGFRFQTIYMAVAYFDRFVSRRVIDGEKYWAVKLLAVACLSLAAKMEESKVPTLSEYPMEHYTFDNNVIQRMELLVLNTLEWRMGCITPFDFTNYFVSRFCKYDSTKCVISRTVEIILCVLRDVKLVNFRPSVLAVAATLLVLNKNLTKENLEQELYALPLNDILQIDDVFACYNQMLSLNKERLKSPSNLSPNQLLRNDNLEKTSLPSALGSKRKSLTFLEDDRIDDKHQVKRPC